MNNLYLAPIGDWRDKFDQTVAEPIEVPKNAPKDLHRREKTRLWGTDPGQQKRMYFDEMSNGDIILFYHEGRFFASGRVGTTFESEGVGESLWGAPDSSLLFTITDYKEIDLQRDELRRILGYGEGWYPHGFMEISDKTRNTLLQKYNSIEEAFQHFQEDGEEEDDEPDLGPDEETEDPREHTKIQYYLIQLGHLQGYDVYVAKNDKNREYDGEKLGSDCVDSLQLPGFSSATTDIIEYVDVIWLEDEYILKLFEVESTTSIYSGILRMTDFSVKVPNIAVDMHIVAPDEDEDKVRKEMTRPTFDTVLGDDEHCDLSYISFDDVRERYETVQNAGPLQDVF